MLHQKDQKSQVAAKKAQVGSDLTTCGTVVCVCVRFASLIFRDVRCRMLSCAKFKRS